MKAVHEWAGRLVRHCGELVRLGLDPRAWLGRQGSPRQALTRRRSPVQIWAGPPPSNLIRGGLRSPPSLHRNLLLFSLILIGLGLASGYYLVIFFGILMLFPALSAPSRPPPRPSPGGTPVKQEPRRIIPPSPSNPPQQASSPSPPSEPMATAPAAQQSQMYTPILFPTSMFPSLSSYSTPPPPAKATGAKHDERDELVETGAILVILKLLLG